MEEIRPQYEHSKFGMFMFNLCAKATKFLVKHKWLYYLLACTWGIILTVLGLLITLVLGIASIFTKKITFKKYCLIYCILIGPDYWGGFETGLMFLRDQKSADGHINPHEFGHTFQNCILGPFTPFLVTIPSAVRWWYRNIAKVYDTPYDAMWFEDAATQCGKYAESKLKNKK